MQWFKRKFSSQLFYWVVGILILHFGSSLLFGFDEGSLSINKTVGWESTITNFDVFNIKLGFWIVSLLVFGILSLFKIRTAYYISIIYLYSLIIVCGLSYIPIHLSNFFIFNSYLTLILLVLIHVIWSLGIKKGKTLNTK